MGKLIIIVKFKGYGQQCSTILLSRKALPMCKVNKAAGTAMFTHCPTSVSNALGQTQFFQNDPWS